MMIRRIHHVQVSIPRGAETLARKFYCEFMGLNEVPKPECLKGQGGLWLEKGDLQVHLGVEDGVDRTATKAHVAYEVDNIALWKVRLNEIGINSLGGKPIPGFDRIEFRDPFGNRVELLQRLEIRGDS